MRRLTACLVLLILVSWVVSAGSQDGGHTVRPRVNVHTDVVGPEQPPPEQPMFSTTLVVKFWVQRGDQIDASISIRCATPEYSASLGRPGEKGLEHLHVGGAIELLRNRSVLLVYNAELIHGSGDNRVATQAHGSVLLQENRPKALITIARTPTVATDQNSTQTIRRVATPDIVLYVSFTFDNE